MKNYSPDVRSILIFGFLYQVYFIISTTLSSDICCITFVFLQWDGPSLFPFICNYFLHYNLHLKRLLHLQEFHLSLSFTIQSISSTLLVLVSTYVKRSSRLLTRTPLSKTNPGSEFPSPPSKNWTRLRSSTTFLSMRYYGLKVLTRGSVESYGLFC